MAKDTPFHRNAGLTGGATTAQDARHDTHDVLQKAMQAEANLAPTPPKPVKRKRAGWQV